MAEQLGALLLDAGRLLDRTPAQAAVEVIGARPGETGVRRAQEREQVAPRSAERGEAEHPEERMAERGAAEWDGSFERERNAERAEHRLERTAPALDARQHHCDLLRRLAGAQEREDLVGDELERASSPRPRGSERRPRAAEA